MEALCCQRSYHSLFENLSFELKPGEVLVVEGRNGSGKTTLLRTLSGIRRADGGKLSWCGTAIEELGADYHEHIAYVGHLDGVKADLTAYENLKVARALGKPAEISLDDALEQVELLQRADVLTQNLSAGQRRRLALDHLRKCLARARQFARALDVPATPPAVSPYASVSPFAGRVTIGTPAPSAIQRSPRRRLDPADLGQETT